jgi:hypothetical protein
VELFYDAPMAADLTLIRRGDSFQLCAGSVFGILWLQTHFESSTWELVCSGQVRISAGSSVDLQDDALAAGLSVHRLTAPAAPEPRT